MLGVHNWIEHDAVRAAADGGPHRAVHPRRSIMANVNGSTESVIGGVPQAILKVMDALHDVDTACSADRPNNETAEAW